MLYGLTPVKSIATYGATAERIRQEITLGTFQPLTKLPAERRFAEELGVARITLREALKILESEGYLEVRRGVSGGTFIVAEPRLIEINIAQLNRSQAACLRALEYWRINQSASARFAATRRSPPDLKRMKDAAGLLREHPEGAARRRAESEFCLSISAASGNVWLHQGIHAALAASFLSFVPDQFHQKDLPFDVIDQLIAAIQGSHEHDAFNLMQQVCDHFWERFRRMLIAL
ncbi:FadR family transcriptional regulator [Pseudomonas yamanorum]|uniref:FadR/GntR family transcriptional regulator n=1 Tax=Pseudomonas yamanorum TaxID=515393 RepID=UPI0015A1CAFA|nr:GntR family transcriptional regulator [Pseudomonas yamanorum]NWD25697.1 FadR family transcriptional regulator [Pseudomonas yamanorum]